MTSASRILDEYARDWEIDQTPSASQAAPSRIGPTVQHLTGAESRDPKGEFRIWFVLTGAQETITSVAGVATFFDAINWTGASSEVIDRLVKATEAAVRALGGGVRSREEAASSSLAAPVVEVADVRRLTQARNDASSRAGRALRAVADLARWLEIPESQAADLLGYRRSYYNWLKGVQPYPATTWDLFEAHAFVEALVDAIGERGALLWLEKDLSGRKRLHALRSKDDRQVLSQLGRPVLFPKHDNVRWQPDFADDHAPRQPEPDPQRFFGKPIELDLPLE